MAAPLGFPGGSVGEESACSVGDAGDLSLIPGSGRSPEGGHGNPFKCSCLENPMDRGSWWVTVHGAAKSSTPRTVACQAPLSWDFPGKNTGVGCHFLLQGIFLTQGSNSSLLSFLQWQAGSLTGANWKACYLSHFYYHSLLRETVLFAVISPIH